MSYLHLPRIVLSGDIISEVARESWKGYYVIADHMVQRIDSDETNPVNFYARQWGKPLNKGSITIQMTRATKTNTKTSMLTAGSEERRRLDDFNATYGSLLKGLHQTFNGDPQHLNQTIGLMFDIKLLAEKLCATPFPGKSGYNIGPSFEYVG